MLGLRSSPTPAGLGFQRGRKVPLPLPSLAGGEKRKSLWISLGALFIFKSNKPKAQPLSQERAECLEDSRAHLHRRSTWREQGGGEGGRSLS